MRVSWITEDKHSETVVEYGTKKGEYSTKATGEHTSYHYFLYKSGKIHHAVIGPLQPGTTYFYRCGGLGPEFSFKTPPSKLPIEFVIVGEWLFFFLLHHARFLHLQVLTLVSYFYFFVSWFLVGIYQVELLRFHLLVCIFLAGYYIVLHCSSRGVF